MGIPKNMNINRLMFIIDRSDAMNLELGDAAMRMTNGQPAESIYLRGPNWVNAVKVSNH